MKQIASAIAFFLVAGCANTPARQVDRIVLRHGGYCESINLAYGTNEWRDCVIQREKERLQRISGLCRNDGTKLVCERPRPGDLSTRENL
jgi:hypothetical protein